MINLFNLARTFGTVKNVIEKDPYKKAVLEETAYNMQNAYPETKGVFDLWDTVNKGYDNIQNSITNTVGSFMPKQLPENLFHDENIIYQNMVGDGIDKKEAKKFVYELRKQKMGGSNVLSDDEYDIVNQMQGDNVSSDDAIGFLHVMREQKRQEEEQKYEQYLADPHQGQLVGGVDNDFQFHNSAKWVGDIGNAITLQHNKDDGMWASAGKTVANVPGNLLKIGSGLFGLGETAIREGAYDTLASTVNQTAKMGVHGYDTAKKIYKEKGFVGGTNEILKHATKFASENPLDVIMTAKPKDTGMIMKGAAQGTALAVKKAPTVGKAVYNIAKDHAIRRFLHQKGNAIKEGVGLHEKRSIGRIEGVRNQLAGIENRDIQILQQTNIPEYDRWIEIAKKAKDDNYAQTPYNEAAKKANDALNILDENLQKNQIQRMKILEESKIERIPMEDVRRDIAKDLRNTFNLEGVRLENGNIIPQSKPGRKSLLDSTNTRDLKALELIDDALKAETPLALMDTVRILQNHVYDSSTGLRVSNEMKRFLERTTGKINAHLKKEMGTEYTKILQEMSDDITLRQNIEKVFSPTKESGASNRGEMSIKRLSSGTTTSGEVRDLALKIKERTGIDLIKEGRLAQLAMEIVGDSRSDNLFSLLRESNGAKQAATSLLKRTTEKFIDKDRVSRKYLKQGNAFDNVIPTKKTTSKSHQKSSKLLHSEKNKKIY